MYAYHSPALLRSASRGAASFALLVALCCGATSWEAAFAQGDGLSLIRNISKANERLEMTVNTSQVLTLESRIPRLVVSNPDLVSATPLSENQIQIAARKPGVAQINLWDEEGKVYTVDLLILGDVRELELTLKNMFPASALRVRRLSNSLVLEGQVDRPEIVSTIRLLAEDYAPKVVNNITVGGAQQVALKVKVMEVSRTKLRRMGFDFALTNGTDFVASSASDILQAFSISGGTFASAGSTVDFGIVNGNSRFLGLIDALQQNNVSKVLADPTITTVSGRPAHFNVGGELPIIVPSGLGQVGIEYKEFGTQVDFVPIVLGNGRIRLEVRPRVSEIDDTRSVTINSFTVPALKVRQVDCGVEMNAGQTLALAGLVQERVEAAHRGLPYLSDLPGIGAAFRKVQEQVNEIELLILVTPEFVEALDAHELPQCGPGMETVSPTHCDLYWRGYIESPACGPCAANGCQTGNYGGSLQPAAAWSNQATSSDATSDATGVPYGQPMLTDPNQAYAPAYSSPIGGEAAPGPSQTIDGDPATNGTETGPGAAPAPNLPNGPQGETIPDPTTGYQVPWNQPYAAGATLQNGQPQYGQPQYGQPQYGQPQYGQPQYGQTQHGQTQHGQTQHGQPQYGQPQYGQTPASGTTHPVSAPSARQASAPGLIGPVGYDVQK